MPIICNQNHNSTEFHLFNDSISYIIAALPSGDLSQLYFGKRLRHCDSFSHIFENELRPFSSVAKKSEFTYTLEHIKQEYPSYGNTDMRTPAAEIVSENGCFATDFKYRSHEIYKGKKPLSGLPAAYVESEDEADTLEILLYDDVIKCGIELSYTVFRDYAAITRSARIVNEGDGSVKLNRAMSLNLDLPDCNFDMVTLCGAWARERNISIRKLGYGAQSIQSLRGASSHHFNPFMALKRPNTDEFSGEVYGFSLIYSGNFLAAADVDTYDVTRVQLGINPQNFRWTLKQGEEFQTPEAVMVYSRGGLNGMSRQFHNLFKNRLARGKWRDRERPVLLNNWEATYFDFDEEKILGIAKTGKELGVELFVLDDGWFGKRNDDTSSLGDWFVNKEKLPSGLTGLSKKINDMGLMFGLWIEPEMVNKDSELYRNHPDWVLGTVDREPALCRNQLILDFSKSEVVDYIYDALYKLFSEINLSYVKWDMNRNMSHVFSRGNDADYQGMVVHKYILGVYDLYERLTTAFPNILFESCAGGGGRFDPGMLYYAPQGWTSDDTDAVERLKIQYGTSLVYPVCSMGAHVSAVPNHQLSRTTSIDTRAAVAYFGAFGYELDLAKLSDAEKEKVRAQIAFMKKNRKLLQFGDFYRLRAPSYKELTGSDGNTVAWMSVSPDKKRAVLGYYKILNDVNMGFDKLPLIGLDENSRYVVSLNGTQCYDTAVNGDELINHGLIIQKYDYDETNPNPALFGDFTCRVYTFDAE